MRHSKRCGARWKRFPSCSQNTKSAANASSRDCAQFLELLANGPEARSMPFPMFRRISEKARTRTRKLAPSFPSCCWRRPTLLWCPEKLSARPRSEEHTSELQSHVNLVCRLLLEKKKKNYS